VGTGFIWLKIGSGGGFYGLQEVSRPVTLIAS